MTDVVVKMFHGMDYGKPDELVFPATNGEQMGKISNTFHKAVNDMA